MIRLPLVDEDEEFGDYEDDDTCKLSLSIRLTLSEFLHAVNESLWTNAEVDEVGEGRVTLDQSGSEPAFVVHIDVRVETGMVAAEWSKNDAIAEVAAFLRTNPKI